MKKTNSSSNASSRASEALSSTNSPKSNPLGNLKTDQVVTGGNSTIDVLRSLGSTKRPAPSASDATAPPSSGTGTPAKQAKSTAPPRPNRRYI